MSKAGKAYVYTDFNGWVGGENNRSLDTTNLKQTSQFANLCV